MAITQAAGSIESSPPSVPPVHSSPGVFSKDSKLLINVERFALPVLLIGIVLFFSFWGKTGSTFRQSTNFQEVGSSQAYLGILTLASLIPLVCGQFDFSVGQVAGFTQIVAATAMSRFGVPVLLSILLAVVFGAAVGAINGTVVAKLGVNSLIVTLGTSGILLGVVNWYTSDQTISTGISKSLTDFGSDQFLGIPEVCFLLLGAALVVYYALQHTPFGRYLTSIGSNARAARLVGLRVERLTMTAFVLSGALAGLAGVLLVARNGSASPQAGTVLDTLSALAAAYLGATAIRPGRFNVLGAMVAVYFIAFSISGLSIAGVQSWVNNVFDGGALFVAVVASTVIGRRRAGVT